MGHHGSKTSTSAELLMATNPRFAWNSAGRNNWYGHPHPLTLKRLDDRRVDYLSTDRHGAIMFHVNEAQVMIDCWGVCNDYTLTL